MGAIRAGTSLGSATSTAYQLGQETSGAATIGAGLGGIGAAARGAAASRLRSAGGIAAAATRGRDAAWRAGTSGTGTGSAADVPDPSFAGTPPAWATRLQNQQVARHRRQTAMHTIKEGDRGGASATPDIKERD